MPAAPRLPRVPSEEEINDYEQRLELTHRREKQTVPALHKRRATPHVEGVAHKLLRSIVRSIVTEAIEDDRADLIVYDTVNAFEEAAGVELTNRQRDKITTFLYDFIYTDVKTDQMRRDAGVK